MKEQTLLRGDIVQISPRDATNPMFGGCLMVVTEPRPWGAMGYVQGLGENEQIGGQAYYRATWAEMEFTGGHVEWMAK